MRKLQQIVNSVIKKMVESDKNILMTYWQGQVLVTSAD